VGVGGALDGEVVVVVVIVVAFAKPVVVVVSKVELVVFEGSKKDQNEMKWKAEMFVRIV